ncbi:MAG: aminomethyl-transferring glycine dehydrogenase subunit GcvPA [Candidatus Riflebacteria bacterium]|nr:aminomethyl-transferring glycine dehydrogenase subunit GcvPA [Candidatus Riflebacteria bacterium]
MAHYVPHTPDEIREMLQVLGMVSLEDLYSDIPESCRLKRPLKLEKGITEIETLNFFKKLAAKNKTVDDCICFLGAGAYDHIIPAAIDHLLLRGDFFTAYTPYQAEVSQGTLQAIYEFQSLISSLAGLDQANASLYEGGSAIVEACLMASRKTRRKKILVADTVNPDYLRVVRSICETSGLEIVAVKTKSGKASLEDFVPSLDSTVAAVVLQYPNFYGQVEKIKDFADKAKEAGTLTIISANPIALAMLEAPGHMGADIVVGEGQPLGINLSFGGPYLGYIAATKHLLRQMPGRIAGKTVDVDGKTGYVLTLQAREQHIRRERAGSNICSNQALMALNATIYMTLMGKHGLKEVANQCFQKAHYLYNELKKQGKVTLPCSQAFFHEFVAVIPNAAKVMEQMLEKGFFAGVLLEEFNPALKDHVLIAVTEKRTKEELDLYVKTLGGILK